MKELPSNLKRDEGLTRASGKREQDALLIFRNRFHHALDGDVLVIPARMRAALVLEGHASETVAPQFDKLTARAGP